MHDIEEFIENFGGEQYLILNKLHQLIISFDEITATIRYKIPFYDAGSWLCYLNPIKKVSIELVFIHGVELSEKYPVLNTRNRKTVAGIIFKNCDEIIEEEIFSILQASIELAHLKGNPFFAKKKK
jgi:hypothetical protein